MHEKYLALARDAGSSGDRIAAENYLQHAEHYFRIINMDTDGDSQNRGRGQQNGSDGRGGRGREGAEAATDESGRYAESDAVAQQTESARTNGADEHTDAGPGEPDGASSVEPKPKRRPGRPNGKGRGARSAAKADVPAADGVSAAPNGADANDLDMPPAEE